MSHRTLRSVLAVSVAVSVLLVAGGLLLRPTPAGAQDITQAYTSPTTLQRGMVVRILDTDKTKVIAASDKLPSQIDGIVVAANDAPVTLSNVDTSSQQIYVANTGEYNVLVSNQNGVIKANQYIVLSSLDGIGMKDDGTEELVVGKALAGFDGKTSVSTTATVKNSLGKTVTVAIGLIPVDINITHNPDQKLEDSRLPGLQFLQSGAQVLVNKTVDPARLYISAIILILVACISGAVIYSGVRSGMVSIGRNPLAKKSIIRGLAQVVITSIIIFIIGLIGVYLLLKL